MQQTLIGMTSHPAAALALKAWLMYTEDKKEVCVCVCVCVCGVLVCV